MILSINTQSISLHYNYLWPNKLNTNFILKCTTMTSGITVAKHKNLKLQTPYSFPVNKTDL